MVATRRHPDGDFPAEEAPTSSPAKAATSTPSRAVSRTVKTSTTQSRAGYTHSQPYLLHLWLLISLPLVIWDTGYIFLRPHSLPGGWLHDPIWSLYSIYGVVDHVYGWRAWDAKSGFSAAQSAMNAIETMIYLFYLVVVWREADLGKKAKEKSVAWYVGVREDGRRKVVSGPNIGVAVVALFATAVMTLSKTMLYWCHEYFSYYSNIGHNSAWHIVIYWIIPNGFWLVFPAYMIYVVGMELVGAIETSTGSRSKRSSN